MKILITIILLCSLTVSGQQNLVPNGSFEKVNDDIFDALNDAQTANASGPTFVTSHLADFDTTKGLFNCWEFWLEGTSNGAGILGVVYGIVPDLYPATGGNSGIPSEMGKISVHNDNNEDYIFYSSSGGQGIRLTQTPNNLQGLDCSPPDTRFGNNMPAEDGENYMALMDMKYTGGTFAGDHSAKPYIGTYFKEPLKKDVEYVLVFSIAKMNRLSEFQSNDGWTNIEDPEIEFHMGNLNSNGTDFANKKRIHKDTYSNSSWEVKTINFTPNKDYEYLRINLNTIGTGGNNIKLTGCFLDNVKIYEACEDPQNQCNNTNYRRDMLDVELKKVDAFDPLAFPDPNQSNKNWLKTVKATNLENVKRLEMEIRNSGGTIVRTIDEWYPPSEYVWDGNDSGGNPLPEGAYEAKIIAVSNDCPNYHISNADVKNFNLKRKYTVFGNVQISSAVVPSGNGSITVPAITGLEEVQWLRVIIRNSVGSEVYNQAFYNPPGTMLLSTSFGDITSLPPTTGLYGVQLEMSNNCQSANLGNNWDHYVPEQTITLNAYTNYNVDPNLFNWAPVPKPAEFQCPYDYTYQDNYLTPRDCCEGDLYIEDVDIFNDFSTQILGNINFGNDVNFGVNSTNSFYAEGFIFGEPGLNIPNGADVLLQPGAITNCVVCREANPNSPPRVFDDQTITSTYDIENPFAEDESNMSSALYPNPTRSGSDISVTLITEIEGGASYTLLDGVGKKIQLKEKSVRGKTVVLEIPEGLSDGVYYVQVSTSLMIQSFKLQIKN